MTPMLATLFGARAARGRRTIGMLGLATLWLATTASPAAAKTAESDLVWIVEDEVVSEDLYAVGNDIWIEGRIEGDLMAVAGSRLVVEGVVTGSVTALAATVVIGGEVGGSVIAAASAVTVTGDVGGDVVAAAFDLAVDGEVGRDLLAAAWSAHTGGEVQRDLRGLFRSLNLGGKVAEDVEVRVDRLHASEGVSILGDFDFQAGFVSGRSHLQDGVEGSLVDREALPPNIRIRAFRLMTLLLLSLLTVASGLLIVRWRTPWVEAAAVRAVRSPWRSLGQGVAMVLSPLVVLALLVAVVLWLPVYVWGPLLVGGIPFLIMAAGLGLLAVLVAHIPVAVATGRRLGKLFGRHWDPAWAYLVGAIIYLSVLQIPRLGGPLAAVVTVAGAGAWLGRKTDPIPPPTARGR